MVHRQLPFLIRLGKAVVQRRLMREEIAKVIPIARRHPVNHLGPPRFPAVRPSAVGPDIPVLERLAAFDGSLKPRMLRRSVSRDKINQHPQAAGMRLGKQTTRVVKIAVTRMHAVKIGHIIAGVLHRRRVKRIEPYGIHAEALDIIELGDDARQITDAIAVRVVKCLRVNLVNDGVLGPCGRGFCLHSFNFLKVRGFEFRDAAPAIFVVNRQHALLVRRLDVIHQIDAGREQLRHN